MPMVIGGKFYPKADMKKLQSRQNSTWKQHDHKRQRSDYSSEIIQPYDRHGKPSEAFIDNFPEEAVDYGFVPSEAEIIGIDSATPPVPQGAEIVLSDNDKLVAEIPEEEYYDE